MLKSWSVAEGEEKVAKKKITKKALSLRGDLTTSDRLRFCRKRLLPSGAGRQRTLRHRGGGKKGPRTHKSPLQAR